MTAPRIAPYGSWRSPITSDWIVAETVLLGQPTLSGGEVYWTETRPSEKGRTAIVRCGEDGRAGDLNPAPFSAQTRVNEYGGGSYVVSEGVVYFCNRSDQRLYALERGGAARAITPPGNMRYADGTVDRPRRRIICVREDHNVVGAQADTTIAAIDLDGGSEGRVLLSGNDFYSSPRVSPDGSRLAWLTWRHPNMPWDATELWVAEIQADGSLSRVERVAGGESESVIQPEWSPDGVLYFGSDRTGWWNLYRWTSGRVEPLTALEVEFGRPQWIFAMSSYAFESPHRIVCLYCDRGRWHLAILDTRTRKLDSIETPYTEIRHLQAAPGRALFMAGSPAEAEALVELDLATGRQRVLRRSSDLSIDSGYLSVAESIEFPTERGLTAHAFYYAPKNRDFSAPAGERPPLIVRCHGGPTSAAASTLNFQMQYWTSRGFAVLDVNHGGSTGYGRAYRERLNGRWGIVDVEDCENAARYLVERGLADPTRTSIVGGSAGGFTVLASLTTRRFFKAGASYFGVSDQELLAGDHGHKFEWKYSFSLIGPWPERRDLYRERSPIHAADKIESPVIFFQGLEDVVVPPAQTEFMVEALRKKGLPVAYVAFQGEGHGFRGAAAIKRALDAELYFYSRVFGFAPADPIEPVPIENFAVS